MNDKIEEALQQDDSSFSVEELLNENTLLDDKSGDEMFEQQFSNAKEGDNCLLKLSEPLEDGSVKEHFAVATKITPEQAEALKKTTFATFSPDQRLRLLDSRLSPKFSASGQLGIDSTPTRQRTSTSSEMSSPHSPVITNTPYVRCKNEISAKSSHEDNVTAAVSNESSQNKNLEQQSTLANDNETFHELDLDPEESSKSDNDETEASKNIDELKSGQENQTRSMETNGGATPPITPDRPKSKNDNVVSPLSSTQAKKTDSAHKTPARSRTRISTMATPEIYGKQQKSKRKRESSESGNEDELLDESHDGQEMGHISKEIGSNVQCYIDYS